MLSMGELMRRRSRSLEDANSPSSMLSTMLKHGGGCATTLHKHQKKNYKSWYCMPPTSADAAADGRKKWKTAPGSLLQRKIPRIDAGQ